MLTKKILDCKGLACPQPVINTKNALAEAGVNELTVIVDNQVAKENVSKFAASQNCQVVVTEAAGIFQLELSRETGDTSEGAQLMAAAKIAAKNAIVAANPDGVTYLLSKDTLGQGSDELGAVLMKSFLYALTEQEHAPVVILLMNSGVRLACQDSPVLEHLQKLLSQGTEILVCGTCLNYFKLEEQLLVGSVTNMYTIVDKISAGKALIF